MKSDDGLANQHLIDNQFGANNIRGSSGRSVLSHFGRHTCQAFEPQARFFSASSAPRQYYRDCLPAK